MQVMRDGSTLAIRLKKDNRVLLLDVETSHEKTVSEGEEEGMLYFPFIIGSSSASWNSSL